MRTRLAMALPLALGSTFWPPPALAQAPSSEPTVIAFRPAAEPRPALKYRLVPERATLLPGNAAIFYHRGILMVTERRGQAADPALSKSIQEKLAHWATCPIAEIPREEARSALENHRSALKEAELGASRLSCDWDLDSRTEGVYLLMPELQEMRSLARLVALQARLAILDGKTDDAMHWIEIGLTMGRHVSEGPTVIQALIGVAIDFITIHCLEDLISAPGTPSLYWAIVDRPVPMIDMRRAVEGEQYLLEKEVPGLRDLDQGTWGADRARRFADEVQRKLLALSAGSPLPGTSLTLPRELPDAIGRIGIAAVCAKAYPKARRALIADGRPEAEVDAMPVVQVAALYSYGEYKAIRDDLYKWMNLPFSQSHGRIDMAERMASSDKTGNPLLAMFRILAPPLRSIRLASIRVDRQLDALACVEAIRLHAAAHGGAFPASLDAITEVPVPADPATGRPFAYTLEGGMARLSSPVPPGAPDHPSYQIRYVLKPTR